jgi:hypothetical protein
MSVPATLVWEVPANGVFWLWLIALAPAAVVTMLKGRWLYFAVGWLTLGIPWFFGALSPAAPDSGWARHFYDEEKRARAASFERYPRSHRQIALWLIGALTAVAVLGLVAVRPAPILGVGGSALQHSVGGGNLGLSSTPCLHLDRNTWRCAVYDDQGSSTIEYQVKTRRLGCWTASRIGGRGEGNRRQLSGCVTIWDKIFG